MEHVSKAINDLRIRFFLERLDPRVRARMFAVPDPRIRMEIIREIYRDLPEFTREAINRRFV